MKLYLLGRFRVIRSPDWEIRLEMQVLAKKKERQPALVSWLYFTGNLSVRASLSRPRRECKSRVPGDFNEHREEPSPPECQAPVLQGRAGSCQAQALPAARSPLGPDFTPSHLLPQLISILWGWRKQDRTQGLHTSHIPCPLIYFLIMRQGLSPSDCARTCSPPASVSHSAGNAGVHHHAQPSFCLLAMCTVWLQAGRG